MERKAYVVAEHCTGKALAATAWRRWATYSPWMPKSAAGLPVAGKGVHPKGTSACSRRGARGGRSEPGWRETALAFSSERNLWDTGWGTLEKGIERMLETFSYP